MPSIWTNSTHWIHRSTNLSITTSFAIGAPYASTIHSLRPKVISSKLCYRVLIFGGIYIFKFTYFLIRKRTTITYPITPFCFIVQIYSHPPLITNFNGFISLSVTIIRQRAIHTIVLIIRPTRWDKVYRITFIINTTNRKRNFFIIMIIQ